MLRFCPMACEGCIETRATRREDSQLTVKWRHPQYQDVAKLLLIRYLISPVVGADSTSGFTNSRRGAIVCLKQIFIDSID